jgi:hypothetical protein
MFEFLKRIFGHTAPAEPAKVAFPEQVKPVAEIQPGPFAQDLAPVAAAARAPRKTAGRRQPAKTAKAKDPAAPKVPRPGSRRTKKS